MDWKELLSGLFGGAGIVIAKALFDYFRNRDQDDANVANTITESSERVMARMEQRMDDMEREIKLLKKRERIYARNQQELQRLIEELKMIMKEHDIDYDVEPELEEIPLE